MPTPRSRFPFDNPGLATSRLLQAAIAAILVWGVATRNLAVAVNGLLALLATFLPSVLARDLRLPLAPRETLWVTLALFLHIVGMTGLYVSVPWWAHLTHTLSATVVAAVGYVSARAVDEYAADLYLPPRFMTAFVLLFTLGLGVFWEVLEFAGRGLATRLTVDPVLYQYGPTDTLADLLFNLVGAVVVATLGGQAFGDLTDRVTERLHELRERGDADGGRASPPDHEGHGSEAASHRVSIRRLALLVDDARANARVTWLLAVALAAVAVRALLTGDPARAVLVAGILSLVVLPPALAGSPRIMLPWPVVLLAGVPSFGYALAGPGLTGEFVAYLAVAAVALVVAVELDLFTSVEMTPGFAVAFVVVTTVAVAGVWALVRWGLDAWLGTGLLFAPGRSAAAVERALMWEFVYSALAGVVAGLVFDFGFRRRAARVGSARRAGSHE